MVNNNNKLSPFFFSFCALVQERVSISFERLNLIVFLRIISSLSEEGFLLAFLSGGFCHPVTATSVIYIPPVERQRVRRYHVALNSKRQWWRERVRGDQTLLTRDCHSEQTFRM